MPEVSGHERGTAASIANLLQACGSDAVLTGIGGHGMAAIYDPKFSSWSLIPASFGRYFHVISVRLRPIVRPKRITQWVSRFQVFRMLLPLQHQQVNLKGLSILFRLDYATSCLDFFNHEVVIAATDLRSGTRCPLDDGDPLTNEVRSLGVGWLGCPVRVGYPDADRSASGTV